MYVRRTHIKSLESRFVQPWKSYWPRTSLSLFFFFFFQLLQDSWIEKTEEKNTKSKKEEETSTKEIRLKPVKTAEFYMGARTFFLVGNKRSRILLNQCNFFHTFIFKFWFYPFIFCLLFFKTTWFCWLTLNWKSWINKKRD